jgi:hypothetical protein
VVSKVEWAIDKTKSILGIAPSPSIALPAGVGGGATTTNNTASINAPITINGASAPKDVADAIGEHLRQVVSDAYAAGRGGRR